MSYYNKVPGLTSRQLLFFNATDIPRTSGRGEW